MPISLSEMDSVKLLNRLDKKYILPSSKLIEILRELIQDYYILQINDVRNCRYTTVYYDTDDFMLFRQHQNGKMNRYKVRFRRYEDSDVNFFELKFKNNKSRTIKERLETNTFKPELTRKKTEFLEKKTQFIAAEFKPVITIHYRRMTLVSKEMNERMTIDTDLWFENNNARSDYNNLVIIETKQGGNIHSYASEVLRNYHIHGFSISKYCLGIVSLYNEVKKNRFKVKQMKINKICYECN